MPASPLAGRSRTATAASPSVEPGGGPSKKLLATIHANAGARRWHFSAIKYFSGPESPASDGRSSPLPVRSRRRGVAPDPDSFGDYEQQAGGEVTTLADTMMMIRKELRKSPCRKNPGGVSAPGGGVASSQGPARNQPL